MFRFVFADSDIDSEGVHFAAKHTPEALPGIIESLLADGYTIVPISQILLTGEYTIDHTGRQCGSK